MSGTYLFLESLDILALVKDILFVYHWVENRGISVLRGLGRKDCLPFKP